MTLSDLQAAWREELQKGTSSPIARSPAFREALLYEASAPAKRVDFDGPGSHNARLGGAGQARAVGGEPGRNGPAGSPPSGLPPDSGPHVGAALKVGTCVPGWHSVGPSFPRSRFTRAQRLGLVYERRVREVLLPVVGTLGWLLRDHEWFLTRSGSWLQPDFFLEAPAGAILLEAKLTFTVEGVVQLARYRREIQAVTGIQAVPALVCKNLLQGCPKVVGEFEDIEGGCVWHLPW